MTENISLTALMEGDDIIPYYSDLLGEEAGNKADIPDDGKVYYRVSELQQLKGMDPDHVKKIHMVKRVFSGSIALFASCIPMYYTVGACFNV